ncbi:proline-rich protein HaeIII subfamily 1-like [Dipodomys spectabilis]|uniref:proline-rich protein HaeIII subfamily 1-like n=1 Tax=Dipodomys spectabilis TaxID=105255 RepID=UPI001C53AF48|nr:proline-rich protein HaeIII subfamily 1-like [Dipodomys spectabilis]
MEGTVATATESGFLSRPHSRSRAHFIATSSPAPPRPALFPRPPYGDAAEFLPRTRWAGGWQLCDARASVAPRRPGGRAPLGPLPPWPAPPGAELPGLSGPRSRDGWHRGAQAAGPRNGSGAASCPLLSPALLVPTREGRQARQGRPTTLPAPRLQPALPPFPLPRGPFSARAPSPPRGPRQRPP